MDTPLTPQATVDRTYDYKDLLTAYIDAGRYQSESYKVVGDYYLSMVEALSQCLGVDLAPWSHGPRTIDSATGQAQRHLIFLPGLQSSYNEIKRPWGFQTMFPGLLPYFEKHEAVFQAHIQTYKADLYQAMCEAFEIAYPDKLTAIVTSQQLRDAGVDDRNPPDFWSIWREVEDDW